MLEGREISIIQKNEAFDPFFSARCDPEFFQKYYKNIYNNILSKDHELLGDIAFITDGEHGNATTSETGYSKYYGARNVLSGVLSNNQVEYISELHHNKLRKSALLPRDVLISCVGANVGYAAIVPDDIGMANIVRNVALIRSNNSEFINEYLHVYLCSSYGKNLYIRLNTGNAQPLVSLDYIKTIPVFKPSLVFQSKLRNLTNFSLDALKKSNNIYVSAEMVLLNTLGMADFSPSPERVNIKSFKDSFANTRRLDAEYYQPKYEDYHTRVFAYPNGWQPLSAVCNLKDSNFTPEESTAYKYIELADIDSSGGISGCTKALGNELPSRARRKVDANDVLISSIEGSLSSCAIVSEKMGAALCSTGFYVINSDKINSEALLVLFKSPLLQNLLKQACSGTILTAINKPEFENIPIPLIEGGVQTKIAALVKESFSLKTESERLLDVAKRAVEIAIEEDEAAGMAYLEANS